VGSINVSRLVAEPMKNKILGISIISSALLFKLVIIHIFGTVVAYEIYIKISKLGDGYLPQYFAGFTGSIFNSTYITAAIYYMIGSVLPGYLAPMLLGILIAILIWKAFKDVYIFINNKLFWICNLFPHFLIWSGSSSKEQIVIICGLIIIDFSAKYLFLKKNINFEIILVIFSFFILFIIRPNYFLIYFTVFLSTLLLKDLPQFYKNLSINIFIILLLIFTIFIFSLFLLNRHFMEFYFNNWIKQVEQSFLIYAGASSNRYEIIWYDIYSFFFNSIWGVPQGLMGPTLLEVIKKPIQIPVFLEGLVYLYILCYLNFKIFKICFISNYLKYHLILYLFVTLIVLFISYPYLIFNPGSALRYKQSLHPILIFFPLLILGNFRKKTLDKKAKKD
jgi:hypothetical protein